MEHLEKNHKAFNSNESFDDASDVILYIKRKNNCYHNCSTGKEGNTLEEVLRKKKEYIILERNYKDIKGYCIRYNKKYDVLVVYEVTFSTNNITEGVIRKWQRHYYDCYFVITRDGRIMTDAYYCSNVALTEHISINGQNLCKKEPLGKYGRVISKRDLKILNDFFGPAIVSSGMYCTDFNNSYFWQSLFSYKQPTIKEKKQAIIDDLISYNLSDLDDADFEIIRQAAYSSIYNYVKKFNETQDYDKFLRGLMCNSVPNYAKIEHVKDGVSVIRFFYVFVDMLKLNIDKKEVLTETSDVYEYYEYGRTYIIGNENITCKKMFGKWYHVNKGLQLSNFNAVLKPWSLEDVQGTKFQFLNKYSEKAKKVIEEMLKDKTYYSYHSCYELTRCLYALSESPYLESLLNCGYPTIIQYVEKELSQQWTSTSEILKNILGKVVSKKETKLFKAFGVPTYMVKYVDEFIDNNKEKYPVLSEEEQRSYSSATLFKKSIMSTINILKIIFDSHLDYFESMNKDMFVKIADKLIERKHEKCSYNVIQEEDKLLQMLVSKFGPKNILSYMDFVYDGIKQIEGEEWRHREYYLKSTYTDYIRMVMELGEATRNAPWKFKNYSDLIKAHDDMISVYNALKREREDKESREKFERKAKGWEKYTFSDDRFEIIYPKSAEEIADEGYALSHCVKSYINKVLSGETKIFFIREKQNIDVPFFTLEIRNDAIRQCHGKCNRNICTEPGLTEFLKKYCLEKNISFNEGEGALGA